MEIEYSFKLLDDLPVGECFRLTDETGPFGICIKIAKKNHISKTCTVPVFSFTDNAVWSCSGGEEIMPIKAKVVVG